MVSDSALIKSMFDAILALNLEARNIPNKHDDDLSIFHKCLLKSTSFQKNALLNAYYGDVLKLKELLPKGNSYHRKLFNDQFNVDKFPSHVSIIFENFVKGITYFAHEKDVNDVFPIYHRMYSCGPARNKTYRLGNLVCLDNIDKKEIKRRKSLIERCYIERLIFNELYINETLFYPEKGTNDNKQNEGHLYRLDLTKQDFESCFPKTSITVKIKYNLQVPVELEIKKIHGNGCVILKFTKDISIGSFGQKIYNEAVFREKHTDKNPVEYKVFYFDKRTTFEI
jgi:hypothetical protein